MLRKILLAALLISGPALADPQQDADYIVSQTVTQELFAGALSAMGPVIMSAMQNDLREKGIKLSDPDRFMELLVDEFIEEFTASMQGQTGEIYLRIFSDEELSGIADFYRTPAGQALINATPDMMMAGAELGEKAGQQAGKNAGARLAATIEAEGLVLIEDPEMLEQFLDTLR